MCREPACVLAYTDLTLSNLLVYIVFRYETQATRSLGHKDQRILMLLEYCQRTLANAELELMIALGLEATDFLDGDVLGLCNELDLSMWMDPWF